MTCLFCNEREKNYRPEPGIEYICGTCVCLLADADQDDLKRAYRKALDKGYLRKASALESFMHEEANYGKAKKSKRDLERERSVRKVRPSRHEIRA